MLPSSLPSFLPSLLPSFPPFWFSFWCKFIFFWCVFLLMPLPLWREKSLDPALSCQDRAICTNLRNINAQTGWPSSPSSPSWLSLGPLLSKLVQTAETLIEESFKEAWTTNRAFPLMSNMHAQTFIKTETPIENLDPSCLLLPLNMDSWPLVLEEITQKKIDGWKRNPTFLRFYKILPLA